EHRVAAAKTSVRFQVRHRAVPTHSLLVEEVDQGNGSWFTIIVCLGPPGKREWGFRLDFEDQDLSNALHEKGLTPERLGGLRGASAPAGGRCRLAPHPP